MTEAEAAFTEAYSAIKHAMKLWGITEVEWPDKSIRYSVKIDGKDVTVAKWMYRSKVLHWMEGGSTKRQDALIRADTEMREVL